MTTPDRPKRLTTNALHEALVAAGVIRAGENIRRIVIDAQAGHVVVIHVERYGDTRLLDVVRTLDGIEVRKSPQTGFVTGERGPELFTPERVGVVIPGEGTT